MSTIELSIELLFILLRSMGVVVTFAYVLSRTRLFKRFFYSPLNTREKVFLIFFFGLLSISGTYLGIFILDAYANIRAIGAVVAGFLGGPVVGLLAGAIGGMHRYFLGGFTAFACAVGTMTSGFIGGLFQKVFRKQEIDGWKSFWIGFVALVIEMIIVVIFSRPIDRALELVSIISLPMILANATGISIFVSILNNIFSDIEDIRANQAKIVLNIADRTLRYFNKGFNCQQAIEKAASVILEMTGVSAVAITDREKIVAFVGTGADHHRSGQPFLTSLTKKAIAKGEIAVANTKRNIGCPREDCKLRSVVIAPLKWNKQVMGALKLYQANRKISKVDISLASGISSLLSTQIKLARVSEQAKLKTEAELKALQAQINPHFLFNSLNTIASFIRTDHLKARELLFKLSSFFRSTLTQGQDLIPLEKEIEFTKNYFSIEKARFNEKIKLEIDFDHEMLSFMIPSFTLQPLVENAIRHGILPKNDNCVVRIKGRIEKNNFKIEVYDNGMGIEPHNLEKIVEEGYGKNSGIGLSNVANRIENLFGSEYGIKVKSEYQQWTRVLIMIPIISVNNVKEDFEYASISS